MPRWACGRSSKVLLPSLVMIQGHLRVGMLWLIRVEGMQCTQQGSEDKELFHSKHLKAVLCELMWVYWTTGPRYQTCASRLLTFAKPVQTAIAIAETRGSKNDTFKPFN
jgi:hypothetical protein